MTETTRKIVLGAALVLPIAALGVLVGRAEVVVQTGTEWAVRIRGYDPRDLLRGQYLAYSIDWKLQGEDCKGEDCCYCLWNANPGQPMPPEPAARIIACADHAPCESYFPVERVKTLNQYFVPEGEGQRLESAIRTHEAMILLRVAATGRVAITNLLLDRKPWQDVAP